MGGMENTANGPWVAIAYRYGWTNNGHYIVRTTTDLRAAIDAADAECAYRGEKYGVTVYDTTGKAVHHASSIHGEKRAHHNPRIELFESVGLEVVVALERGKPMSPEKIKECWEHQKAMGDLVTGVTAAAAHGLG